MPNLRFSYLMVKQIRHSSYVTIALCIHWDKWNGKYHLSVFYLYLFHIIPEASKMSLDRINLLTLSQDHSFKLGIHLVFYFPDR